MDENDPPFEEPSPSDPVAVAIPPAEPPVEEPLDEKAEPLKKPRKRRRLRRRWIALIVVASVIVLLVIAAFITAHYTSRSAFCDTCHEMEPYYASWQTSSHATAECIECHIPPGFVAYVQTKLFSFREIWVHITGADEAPLAATRDIPNGSCFRCHDTPADLLIARTPFAHNDHTAYFCISCHTRLVHRDVNPPYYKSPGAMASCLECHDGKIAPSDCTTCHPVGHEPRGECSVCHNTEGWTGITHQFPITGGHADLGCTDCHVDKPGVAMIPGIQLPVADPACVSCHGDQHGQGLTDCARCHTPDGWIPANFTHTPESDCSTCHTPQHEAVGQCSACHGTESWARTHPFQRTGAHADLTCTDCHKSGQGLGTITGTQLPKVSPSCVSCHGVQHPGLTDCAGCHTTGGWIPSTFKHSAGSSCSTCHTPGHADRGQCSNCHRTTSWAFVHPSSGTCSSCHTPPHEARGQCSNCHSTRTWVFSHPRVGPHTGGGERPLSCTSCHPNGFGSYSCLACHDTNAGGGGDD
jgi:nitrate/TMAO reductase-like tetraheme cytochrome c subunit